MKKIFLSLTFLSLTLFSALFTGCDTMNQDHAQPKPATRVVQFTNGKYGLAADETPYQKCVNNCRDTYLPNVAGYNDCVFHQCEHPGPAQPTP